MFSSRASSKVPIIFRTFARQNRGLHVTKVVEKGPTVGLVGMGHVGKAVCNNLLRNGYTVTAMTDIKPDNCNGFPDTIAVKSTAKEVAEMSEIVVSGKENVSQT